VLGAEGSADAEAASWSALPDTWLSQKLVGSPAACLWDALIATCGTDGGQTSPRPCVAQDAEWVGQHRPIMTWTTYRWWVKKLSTHTAHHQHACGGHGGHNRVMSRAHTESMHTHREHAHTHRDRDRDRHARAHTHQHLINTDTPVNGLWQPLAGCRHHDARQPQCWLPPDCAALAQHAQTVRT
jgi:hypothetical protein